MNYTQLPSKDVITKTVEALKTNGIDAHFFENKDQAIKKVYELIPEGSEVMTMTSLTIDSLGISKQLNESGKYDSVRATLNGMDATKGREKRKLGAAPDYAIGSVHAVTQDGKVLIASASGSQLPGYAYGAGKVVWVIGTQKIMPDITEAMNRIETYVLPLESERAKKAYGVPGSAIYKLLRFNKEVPGRITVVFIHEVLGF